MLSDVQAEDEFIELNDTPGAYTNADHLVKQNSTPDGLDFVTNSFKMTATNVMTLTLAALGDDRAYGIPDAGDDADFMLTKASGNVALNYWLESPDADPDADLELANKRYVDRRTVWAEEEIASAVGDETGMTLDYTPFANSFMLFFNGQRLKQVGSSPGQGEFTRTGTTVAWDAQYIDAGYYVVASYMYQAS